MTNSIKKIKTLKVAIGLTKSVSGTINSIVEMVNHEWTHCGEPYPLPVGEYKRRAWLLADLERMLAQLVDEAHAEALEENKRFDWLTNRFAMFWGGCDNEQRDEIVAIAWEQARHIIEAEEESKSQKQWKLDAIWKHTHRDYKGECDGVRSILICRNGTTSVPLENLTDSEIEQRSYCWK